MWMPPSLSRERRVKRTESKKEGSSEERERETIAETTVWGRKRRETGKRRERGREGSIRERRLPLRHSSGKREGKKRREKRREKEGEK
ncbi:hypothetical protein AMTR_s00001p00272850 [Amborella trichopoda]|uniref:Uncharacterized protein n=1 Tax=Amborella trichopoda TaxID=13333 RepID=W1NLK3_AMBTC|nr:hypothetical protein AMTR_s00001p00272850 [Amborella trichopoda]